MLVVNNGHTHPIGHLPDVVLFCVFRDITIYDASYSDGIYTSQSLVYRKRRVVIPQSVAVENVPCIHLSPHVIQA